MPNKLKDIDVEELSLVDSTANRTKFAIKKRRQHMDELIKMLKSVLGDAGVTEEITKQAGMIPEDQGKVIVEKLKVLEKYKEQTSGVEDLDDAIKFLVKASCVPAKVAEDEGFDVEKIGAKFAKATLEQLKKIKAIIDGVLTAEESKEKSAKSPRELELEAELKKRDDEKAAELKKKAEDSEAAKDKMITDLKAENETLRKARGIKKSADGQEGDPGATAQKGEAYPWSSINL